MPWSFFKKKLLFFYIENDTILGHSIPNSGPSLQKLSELFLDSEWL